VDNGEEFDDNVLAQEGYGALWSQVAQNVLHIYYYNTSYYLADVWQVYYR
jgi:hypothetical protein